MSRAVRLLEALEVPVLLAARAVISGVLLLEEVSLRRRMARRVRWVWR